MGWTRWTIVGVMAASAIWGQARTRLAGPVPEFTVGGVEPGTRMIADFGSIQEAVDAVPEGGAVIRIRPGVYRERVRIDKAGVQMRGEGGDAGKVTLAFGDDGAGECASRCPATLTVSGENFYAEGMTIVNDGSSPGSGVALRITGDRAVVRRVRTVGGQASVSLGSPSCSSGGGCVASRMYFEGCMVEGIGTLVAGEARAVFDGCELRKAGGGGGAMATAGWISIGVGGTFVLDGCRWTGYGAGSGSEGRGVTVYVADGVPGASAQILNGQEAAYRAKVFLRGTDGWDPERVR